MSTPELQGVVDGVRVEPALATIDLRRRFVRVTGRRANGFVAFDFALGEPEIFAELLLPSAAFEEFCVTNQVEFLPEADTAD